MSRSLDRRSESGLSLAEVLVGMAAGTIVLVSALTMLDYGRRVADAQDDVLARNRVTAAKMAARAAGFADHPAVAEIRQTGMVVAIELHPERGNHEDGHAVEIAGRRGLRMYRAAMDAGALLRPLGDVLYWMPPYCIDDPQLDLLATATAAALEQALPCA